MDISILNNFYAKSDKQTLLLHIDKCLNILNELSKINQLNEDDILSLKRIIIYHDIGKIVNVNQEAIMSNSNKKAKIRHEILSSMLEGLKDYERLIILTHHKSNSNIDMLLNEIIDFSYDDLKKYQDEIYEKTGIKSDKSLDDLFNLLDDEDLLKNKKYIFLKGIFMLCDHIGSANINEITITPKFNKIYNFDKFTSIQESAKNNTNKNILIKAPTGFGKTETAFLFADTVQNKFNNRRIFYILPFVASINAMYHRLKNLNVDVGMLHGKAQYFLYKELENINDVKEEYSIFKKMIKPVTVCTIFQIIKCIFNCKYNEMILAMLSNAIFIIDEIHCFDKKNLMLIVETLKYLQDNFNTNICVMSASIPNKYSNYVMDRLNINTTLSPTLLEYKKIKRHKIIIEKDKNIIDKINQIKNNILENKKVLICVNLVDTSQYIYRELKSFCQKNNKIIKLLHSRFATRDREKIEKAIIEEKKCDVLIGTQAIEVSLDIDFDELYTEIAPIDALLQRMGRVNRKRIEKLKDIKNIHVLKEFNDSKIYDLKLIDNTWKVLEQIDIVEEDHVQNYINNVYKDDFSKEDMHYISCLNEILNNIKMGEWDKSFKESMLDNMSVQVIPSCLYNEYQEYIDKCDYMSANSLFLNISKNKYNYFKMNDCVTLTEDNLKIINCYYDSEIGLTNDIILDNQFL